jgi:hypothetical protein
MITYPILYSFTDAGLEYFKKYMEGSATGESLESPKADLAKPVPGTGPFLVEEFESARAMAAAVCAAFGGNAPQAYAGDIGLWAWLTAVLADQVCPVQDNGVRKLNELWRWYPAAPNDWWKAQRHLIRMPTLLYAAFGSDADHLLSVKPSILPDIREQLTSQQDMFSRNFQRACRTLYWNEEKGTTKRGAGSGTRRPGTPYRLAAVRKQLDVTWDMTDLGPERILDLLPAEFDGFKPAAAS